MPLDVHRGRPSMLYLEYFVEEIAFAPAIAISSSTCGESPLTPTAPTTFELISDCRSIDSTREPIPGTPAGAPGERYHPARRARWRDGERRCFSLHATDVTIRSKRAPEGCWCRFTARFLKSLRPQIQPVR